MKTMSATATGRQPVCRRCRYHADLDRRLPDQMIKYCENEKYAQSITKASSRLPRSWKCDGATIRSSGGRRLSHARTMIRNARPRAPGHPG